MRCTPCFLGIMPDRCCKLRLKNWLGVKSSATRIVGLFSTSALRGRLSGGDVQQLFADITDIANALAQVIATGGRQLVAHLLHIGDNRRP